MNRRQLIQHFLGQHASSASASWTSSIAISNGIDPYDGPWGEAEAAHLLRRTCFGPTLEQLRYARDIGLEATMLDLFQDTPLPEEPLNLDYSNDPFVPIGNSWINKPFSTTDTGIVGYRIKSIRAWTVDQLLAPSLSAREKLTLFWHNHFAINGEDDPVYLYHYIHTLRSNAWGNFKTLVQKITLDPTMLRFLNGNQNTRRGVNENYARELLELFTIGKGPQVGPGDYTHYTEDDVLAIARALTGWKDEGHFTTNVNIHPRAVFIASSHDTGTKTLSHRFGQAVVTNQDDNEYKAIIDIIFQQREVARFIIRKLYRWYVYYEISEETEATIIDPLAEILILTDFEIKPVLITLLTSKHFFDARLIGPLIKNPLDFSWGLLKQCYIQLPATTVQKYNLLSTLNRTINLQQMEYFNPPEVAGWKAYYQEPFFYRIWINSTTLITRMNLTNRLAVEGISINGFRLWIQPLEVLKHCSEPGQADLLIAELAYLFFPQPLEKEQLASLKEILLPGLPDYVWTNDYYQYVDNPSNTAVKNTLDKKLRQLFSTMLSMAEHYLS